MNEIKKYIYICILLEALIGAKGLFAQSQNGLAIRGDEADISLLSINSANMFNQGSTFVNSSFINGAVNISDYSGNLTIGHSMNINYPNDLKTKLTLIFNSNTSHAYFEDFVGRDNCTVNNFVTDYIGIRENGVNAACWIFGVNGIAVQTTNFEKNFFLGITNNPDPGSEDNYTLVGGMTPIFSGTQVPILATGYNYTNDLNYPCNLYERKRIKQITDVEQGPTVIIKDAIRIMNAEGNVITLSNPNFINSDAYDDSIDYHLVGKYFDADEKSNGYAIVEWLDPTKVYGERKIYYKPGDGLTYYFEEEYVTYQNYSQPFDWGNRRSNQPKIAYLKKITSQNGDRIEFTYSLNNIFGNTVTNGRKFLTKIQYFKDNANVQAGTEINFSYIKNQDSSYKILVQNSSSNESYTVNLCPNSHFSSGEFNTLVRDSSTSSTSIMQVNSIQNDCDTSKTSYFTYDNHIRRYTYGALQGNNSREDGGVNPMDPVNYYFLKYPTGVMTSRQINKGEKNTFTYLLDNEMNSSVPLYDSNLSYNIDDSTYKDIGGEGRKSNDPLEFQHKHGYFINTYSNNPNADWSYFREKDPYKEWYRYFSAYHYANMYNTMRDNYACLMIKNTLNSVWTGSVFKPISKKEYNYSWGHTLYAGPNEYPDNFWGQMNERSVEYYDDLSAKITNIITEITTTNLDNASLNFAKESYKEKKYFEQLKTTSKFKSNSNIRYLKQAIATETRITKESLYDGDVELQSILYKYKEDLIYTFKHINGYSNLQYFIIERPEDLSLLSKEISYKGVLKGKLTNSEVFHESKYICLPAISGLYADSCFVRNIEEKTSCYEEIYRTAADRQSIKTVNSFSNVWGFNLPGNAWMDPAYIYKPSLPSETVVSGKKGTGNWGQKSRKTMSYYISNNYKIGRLYQENNYGSTNDNPVTTTYDYNEDGEYKGYLDSITQNNGLTTTFKYNGEAGNTAYGRLACTNGITIPNISYVHSGFQPEPFKTTKTFNGKSFVTYTGYDGKGNLLFSTDENGYYTTNIYDALGRIKKIFKPGSYDISCLTLPINSNNYNNKKGSVLYEYNDALWTPEVTTTTYFNSSENDNTATKTISKFNPSDLAYENYFNAVSFDSLVSKEKYNYLGKKINSVDAMGRNVFYHYDEFMNLHLTRFGSDASSAPTQTQTVGFYNDSTYFKSVNFVDEENKYQGSYYDMFGNILTNVKSGVLQTKYTYNGLNQLISVTSPGNKVTTYEYDSFGNVNKKISPDEGTTRFKYDKFGRLRFKFHVGTGELVFNNYDALNRLVSTGVVSNYSESDFTNLNAENTNSGLDDNSAYFVLVNIYDDYDTPGSIFSGKSYPFSPVNLNGKLVATAYRDKPGNSWNYDFISYDCLGRITGQKTGSKQLTYNYDNLGNIKKVNINGDYGLLYEYDKRNRLRKVYSDKGAAGDSLKLEADYSYFNDGQIETETKIITPLNLKLSGGLIVTSDKKFTGQKTVKADTVQILPGAEVVFKAENKITLKPGFRAKKGSEFITKLETVTVADLNKLTTVNDYYDRGFIKSKTDNFNEIGITGSVNTEVFYEGLGYKTNSNGNITSQVIRNNQTKTSWPTLNFTYTYDAYNRLTGDSCNVPQFGSTYSYDADGNFITKNTGNDNITYTCVPGRNELLSVTSSAKGTVNFVYDGKGRMTSDGYSGVTISNYNYQNLPLSSTGATYSYNGNGERITKNNEYYLRDYAGRELAVYDLNADTLKSVNFFGNGMIGRYLADEDENIYYAKDHLGTVRATMNENGDIENAMDYYPYGEEITGRSISYGTNAKYKFTGKERDTETSYDYFGARNYNNQLGVWNTIDPSQDKNISWSSYSYAFCNPLRIIDPDGRNGWDFLKGVVKGFGKHIVSTVASVAKIVSEGPTGGIDPLSNMQRGMALQSIVENPSQVTDAMQSEYKQLTTDFGSSESSGEAVGEIAGVVAEVWATKKLLPEGLQLKSSISEVMGDSYKAVGEVSTSIKNTNLLQKLNATSKGDWTKIYEAGIQDGNKIEVHYFKNNSTGKVFDVKTKYDYWHQKEFKNIGE